MKTTKPKISRAQRQRERLVNELQDVVGEHFHVKFCPDVGAGHEEASKGHQFHLGFSIEFSDNLLHDIWADDRPKYGSVASQFADGLDLLTVEVQEAAKRMRAHARKSK